MGASLVITHNLPCVPCQLVWRERKFGWLENITLQGLPPVSTEALPLLTVETVTRYAIFLRPIFLPPHFSVAKRAGRKMRRQKNNARKIQLRWSSSELHLDHPELNTDVENASFVIFVLHHDLKMAKSPRLAGAQVFGASSRANFSACQTSWQGAGSIEPVTSFPNSCSCRARRQGTL